MIDTIEELQHLMNELYVENFEEIEIDQFKENINNIESVTNIASESIQQNTMNGVSFTEKKYIKWQRSHFPTFNYNLRPINDVKPEVIGFDIISSKITYFGEADFELMVQYINMYALQKRKPWKNTDVREI